MFHSRLIIDALCSVGIKIDTVVVCHSSIWIAWNNQLAAGRVFRQLRIPRRKNSFVRLEYVRTSEAVLDTFRNHPLEFLTIAILITTKILSVGFSVTYETDRWGRRFERQQLEWFFYLLVDSPRIDPPHSCDKISSNNSNDYLSCGLSRFHV